MGVNMFHNLVHLSLKNVQSAASILILMHILDHILIIMHILDYMGSIS